MHEEARDALAAEEAQDQCPHDQIAYRIVDAEEAFWYCVACKKVLMREFTDDKE